MKKITNDNDLIFNIVLKDSTGEAIDIKSIDQLFYTFYTDKDDYTYKNEIKTSTGMSKIYIPSTTLANFKEGILKYDVHLSIEDSSFPDGMQDIIYHNKNTNIYIKAV